jgi:hypothetical protein
VAGWQHVLHDDELLVGIPVETPKTYQCAAHFIIQLAGGMKADSAIRRL